MPINEPLGILASMHNSNGRWRVSHLRNTLAVGGEGEFFISFYFFYLKKIKRQKNKTPVGMTGCCRSSTRCACLTV